MIRKSFLLIVMVAFARQSVFAGIDLGFAQEDAGHAGAFMEYAASARTMAMGGANVGVADDATAAFSNPSGLTQLSRKNLVTSYSSLYENTSFGVFNYAQPTVDMGTFGLGVVSLQSGNYDKRDGAGFSGGSFTTSELGVALSHGFEMSDRLSLGSALKVIREEVESFSGTGYGLDLGAMVRMASTFSVGFSARNLLAPKLKLRNEADKYPIDLRMGTRWQAFKRLMVAFDINQTANRSVKPHLGGEYAFNNLLVVRAGLTESEITTGLGIKMNDWGIDYAFGYQDAVGGLQDLGSSHRFGFHVNFGKKVFEQEASLRWQKKGQVHLALLSARMDQANSVIDEELQKAIQGARQVIRRQGFLRAEDLYLAQGYISYFEEEFERSVQSIGEALALEPENARVAEHLIKARAQLTEERTREIVAFELKRVKELYEKADWHGTVKSCEKVLSFLPDNIEAQTYLQDARLRISEPIERAMKIAKTKFERGDYLDAIKDFQQVKEMDPENKEAAQYTAFSIAALEKQASFDPNAQPRMVVELERNSDQSRALYSKGLILYSQGKVRDAAMMWERSVQYDSQNALARSAFNRAQVELKEKP